MSRGPEDGSAPTRSLSTHRLVMLGLLALPIGMWLWALARFYRRFTYSDSEAGHARVFGMADDMYISACFGRSLFTGAGFVWYEGAPRVEGISNPLWAAVVGALHKLPGFTEDRLGLFVVGLNALLLIGAVLAFASATLRALRERGAQASVQRWSFVGAALFLPWCFALQYWSAEGFEVALLALLTFVALRAALAPLRAGNTSTIAFALLAGLATRMDFVVLTVPIVWVALARNREAWRYVAWLLISVAVGAALLLLARHAYYDDWLPNTYYLKATHWALRERLQRGVEQNRVLLAIAALVWLPLALGPVRKRLAGAGSCIVAGLLGFDATVAYSTYVGGDAWRLFAGYDRHTVVGGVLLAWSHTLLFANVARTSRARVALAAWCVGLAAAAACLENGASQLHNGLLAEHTYMRNYEWDWIRYGKVFREVAEPGARVAICPAGAIVYFSHRGGVDLLGKVEPLVAHLAVSSRQAARSACWRNAPGHNKGDDELVFETRKPEFARGKLPAKYKALYTKLKYRNTIFLVRKDTNLLRNPLL